MAFYVGQIVITSATFAPRGWYPCDGRVLPWTVTTEDASGQFATEPDPLTVALGSSFGGDGSTSYAVPNLMDQVPTNLLPIICSNDGTFNSSFPPPAYDASSQVPYLGQVSTYTSAYAPTGWADCDGAAIPISQNTSLYAIIGPTFGGNGSSTFGLPDLEGLRGFTLAGEIGQCSVESTPASDNGTAMIAISGTWPQRS